MTQMHHNSMINAKNQVLKTPIRQKKQVSSIQTKTYLLENLGCANCAAKMEKKILALPEVESATITFATKQLRISAPNPEQLIPVITELCNSIEDGIFIKEREYKKNLTDDVSKKSREGLEILIGILFFAAGILVKQISLPLFIVGYLILGKDVLQKAFKNILHRQFLDENFLMSIATIGAFIIQEYPEAIGVMLFYRIGELFEHRAVEKSRSQIMETLDLRPDSVNLILNGQIQTIPAEDVMIGDILLVRPGDRIPLDGVIVEGDSRIDTSPVTGEPIPVTVTCGDEVISGCINTIGELKIRVQKNLSESMVTKILNSVENASASKPVIERFITRFARIYTPCVLILAFGTALIPSFITGNWDHWVYTALTFLVMSCPCALVLSVPLAFFSGIGLGSKKKILFKGGASMETLQHIKAVVMDKTGTLTEGNFILQEIFPSTNFTANELLAIAGSCEQHSSHPIALGILDACRQNNLSLLKIKHLREIAGQGISCEIDDIEVLCGNRTLLANHKIKLPPVQSSYGTEVLIAYNRKYAGHMIISDTIKPTAVSSIEKIKKLGIATAILTGDSKETAEAVAHALHINEVYASLLPQDKFEKLQQLREKHGSVMFVGDGINDAPVLAGADVGAAMGSGADAAIEAADVVFMTSSTDAIPEAIYLARTTNRIARQNVIFSLSVKAIVMILGLCGFASMWLAVFADSGVAMLCVLNSIRILYTEK